MLERDGFEGPDQFGRLSIEGQQAGIFDLVGSLHLANHEFAITVNAEPFAAMRLGQFQSVHESGVLGNVVGRIAESAGRFDVGTARPFQDDGPRGRAWIAAGAAVGVDDEVALVIHGGIL